MLSFTLRLAVAADIDAVLAFWRTAAQDTNRSDTLEDMETLLARDAAEQRFVAAGYERQPEWSRWVKFIVALAPNIPVVLVG